MTLTGVAFEVSAACASPTCVTTKWPGRIGAAATKVACEIKETASAAAAVKRSPRFEFMSLSRVSRRRTLTRRRCAALTCIQITPDSRQSNFERAIARQKHLLERQIAFQAS